MTTQNLVGDRARPRVLLVEDHPVMVDGVTLRLESIGMEVVGVSDSVDHCLALYRATVPDLVLCDVGLGRANTGIDLTERLIAAHPEARILMYSGYTDSDLISAAMDAGAVGYVRKGASKGELAELLTTVVEGGTDVFDRATLSDMVGMYRRRSEPHAFRTEGELTAREQEVLGVLAEGTTATKEVARRLHLGTKTVDSHIGRILKKLDVTSRGAAVAKAYQLGLVENRARPRVPNTP
jgi:DNA-binding NarL/FixJ family response regulator